MEDRFKGLSDDECAFLVWSDTLSSLQLDVLLKFARTGNVTSSLFHLLDDEFHELSEIFAAVHLQKFGIEYG